jgi:hypothetical protein
MQDQTMPGGWIGLESLNHLVLNQPKRQTERAK